MSTLVTCNDNLIKRNNPQRFRLLIIYEILIKTKLDFVRVSLKIPFEIYGI